MMLGKWVTRGLRAVIRAVFYLYEAVADKRDALLWRVQTRAQQPEYVRSGQCQQTGQCCRAIGLEFPRQWLAVPWLVAMLPYWHALRYNFRFQGRKDTLLVYACNELQPDNRCGIHRFKPKLCRDFPQQPLRGRIALHKGCGYVYQARETQHAPATQAVVLSQAFQSALDKQRERDSA